MEILIVRHAESRRNVGVSHSLDAPLTGEGMRQAVSTAAWLFENFRTHGYVGLVSPYLRTLQTASVLSEVTGIEFSVDERLREYRIGLPDRDTADGGVRIPDRCAEFGNIKWPPKGWSGDDKFYPLESPKAFVGRCDEFLFDANNAGIEKLVVVTHGTPAVVLAELALGKEPTALSRRCATAHRAYASGRGDAAKHVLVDGMKNCGMTWVRGGEPVWFSKVVHQQ